jgi:hypothetical protein
LANYWKPNLKSGVVAADFPNGAEIGSAAFGLSKAGFRRNLKKPRDLAAGMSRSFIAGSLVEIPRPSYGGFAP